MKLLLLGLLAIAAMPAAQGQRQTFIGTITDSECADANHSRMRMGATDAECAAACADSHGATYLLFSGAAAYGLSNQGLAQRFAAQKVTVTGVLDAAKKTIQVESIAAAK